jgi:hypothetical protein
MQKKIEMSMIGELSYFLGLKVNQSSTGIFISEEKYLKEMLNKFQMQHSSPVSTPIYAGASPTTSKHGKKHQHILAHDELFETF